MRAGLADVMTQPWLRTARAKGLTEWQVVVRHALRPALLPALSYFGPANRIQVFSAIWLSMAITAKATSRPWLLDA